MIRNELRGNRNALFSRKRGRGRIPVGTKALHSHVKQQSLHPRPYPERRQPLS